MKKCAAFMVAVMMVMAGSVWGDDYVYDSPSGGRIIGRVDKKGFIYSGRSGGEKIGQVIKGVVFDRTGSRKVGRVDNDGRIYDARGNQVLRFTSGMVYDTAGGNVLGKADSMNAAGFWLLQQSKK
jgi:hypothetical protein